MTLDLTDSPRFQVRRRLGAGGFGIVFEAYDRERESVIALKWLHRADATALYRFKREFRTLAGLSHRNLVTLHELVSERQQWLLTMELITGLNFLDHVLGTAPSEVTAAPNITRSDDIAIPTTAGPDVTVEHADRDTGNATDDDTRVLEPGHLPDLRRLRLGLRQIVEGLHHLHRHDVLHRDIKPSNVLVDRAGRVVILDFGLATPRATSLRTDSLNLAGTPAYMSPETGAERSSSAADWYSVGVMLYQALTARLPFSGSPLEILRDKQQHDPVPPSHIFPGVPRDLETLCIDLLRRNPADRPDGEEILGRLGGGPVSSATVECPATVPPSPPRATLSPRTSRPFVGRRRQLALLHEALAETRAGTPVAVHVTGSSGMGKTALVRRFLGELERTDRDIVALAGRCYEREAVPYKALDELVDALTQYLKRLPTTRVESLLPRGMWALARVFPVFQRVEAVGRAPRPSGEQLDVREVRRRASAALREMLGRVAERHPLVLFIDDLQWGDLDSAGLLADLMRPPDQPALLLIACYRREERASSPMIRRLLSLPDTIGFDGPVHTLDVPELSAPEADELATLLTSGSGYAAGFATSIARESRGSPFFIDQLVEHGRHDTTEISLDTVIETRASHLSRESRALLEVTAVAGRPLDLDIAKRAAGLESGDLDILAELGAARFVRTRATDTHHQIEPYHDRVRETISRSLSPAARQRYHAHLAIALQQSDHPDPETLAIHFGEAGDIEQAATYTVAAADDAADAGAFGRASRLYRSALDLLPDTSSQRSHASRALGDALANDGQVIDAATAYMTAAEAADATQRTELRRLAAEQFLFAGHLDEGLRILESVLGDVGLRLPATPRAALVSMSLRRPYMRLRGLRFRERAVADIASDELRRIDVSYTAIRSLGFTDPIRSTELQTRHLLLALHAGEPLRLTRALAFEAISEGRGRRTRARATRLLRAAHETNRRAKNPEADAIVQLSSGMLAYLEGRWRAGHDALQAAEQSFRALRTVPPHNIVVCQLYGLHSLNYLGRLHEYDRRSRDCLTEALDRGDLWAEANVRMHRATVTCLLRDDPAAATDEVDRAMTGWAPGRFHLEHATQLFRRGDFALYAGDGMAAWQATEQEWPRLRKSLLLRVEVVAVFSFFLRARTALAAAAGSPSGSSARRRFLAVARRAARPILRTRALWARPMNQLIRAGVAAVDGDLDQARVLATHAESGFHAVDMRVHAAVARWHRGTLHGGDEGQQLVSEAHRRLAEYGLGRPSRICRMLAPGFSP